MKRIYPVLLLLSLIWVSFQGGVLPYLTFYTLLLIPAGSAAYLFYACRVLRFYQGPSSHLVTRSEGFSFPVILENNGPFPILSLRLIMEKDCCGVINFDDSRVLSLEPGQRLEFTPDVICRYAGAYPIGAKQFVLRDCFGLFTYTGQIPVPWRAVVRPQITNRAEALLHTEPVRSAMELSGSDAAENTLSGELREYRQGDRLHHIHWKNSAKTGRLLVRKPEPRQMEQIHILLLPDAVSTDLEDIRRRDLFLELAVSAADYFCRQNQAAVFYYPDGAMCRIIVDSYGNFRDFYEKIPDLLSKASKDSADWETWLAKQASGGDTILLLNEHYVNENPLTVYR